MRPPEAGKARREIAAQPTRRVSVGDAEFNLVARVSLVPGNVEDLLVDVGGDNGFGRRADCLRPVTCAAGNFEHCVTGELLAQPCPQRREVGLTFGFRINLLIFSRAPGVVVRQVSVRNHARLQYSSPVSAPPGPLPTKCRATGRAGS